MPQNPLLRRIEELGARDVSRFHMPGHKGNLPMFSSLPFAACDLTEIPGADSLYDAEDVILGTELRYRALYGAADTALSAGGGTLALQAMIALALRPGDKLISSRHVHVQAVHAMALWDVHPSFVLSGERNGIPLPLSPEDLERAFFDTPDAKAVLLTSPAYDGTLADIQTLSDICRRNGAVLLIDNAHGAYLKLVSPALHPLDLGADLCCDSAHKTLPALTGAALLHAGNPRFSGKLKDAMRLFGSTSPSYLVLASLGYALDYIAAHPHAFLDAAIRTGSLRERCRARGMAMPEERTEPMKLTIPVAQNGYTADAMRALLAAHRIEPELCGEAYAVLMPSPLLSETDWARAEAFAEALAPSPAIPLPVFRTPPRRVMSLRDAVSAPQVSLPLERCLGRVAGQVTAPCPPGIPVLMPGELVSSESIKILKSAGNSSLKVLQ